MVPEDDPSIFGDTLNFLEVPILDQNLYLYNVQNNKMEVMWEAYQEILGPHYCSQV